MNHANTFSMDWFSVRVSGTLLTFGVSYIRETMLDCHMHLCPNC